MRVLIVDDDPLLRLALRNDLTHAGLEVESAENGSDALRSAAADPPDVIILDLAMPVLDGWNAQRLMKGGQATSEIPIVLLSAHASEGERQKFLDAGFAEVIEKPYDLPHLIACLRRVATPSAPAG